MNQQLVFRDILVTQLPESSLLHFLKQKTMSKKLTLLSTALLIATAMLAQKQDTSTHSLDEVVVTANKVAQKQSSTGKVVTVITKEQIEKSAGKTLAQLLNEQAGLVVTGALQPIGSVQTVNMRGAASGRTLILIDGIPVSDPSDINNNFDLNQVSITEIESVEICKGAQSTLYGSDAIGGVVNIITVKNDVKKPLNVKATLAAGNEATYKGNVQLYGKSGKFSYSAGYAKLKTDGFSAAYDSSGKGKFDKDGFDGNTANAIVTLKATTELNLKAFTRYSDYTAGFDGGSFNDAAYTNKNKNLYAGGGFEFKKDIISLTGNYQYGTLNRKADYGYGTNEYKSNSHFAELYANTKLGSGFSLLQGADYRYASMNNQYKSATYNSSMTDTALSQSSLYASLVYNSKKLNIELGGRLNVNARYGSNNTYTFNPSFTIDKHYRLFGSIATGFKAPSLYQLYYFGGTFYPVGNRNLSPEKSINYELGIQQQYKRFSNRLVFFYREITDGIDYNNNVNQYFNYAAQTVRGLEYEVSVQPIEHLTVTANYTYLSASQNTENRVNNKDTVYNYSLRIPKSSLNVNIGYQITDNFLVSFNGKYQGSRYDAGGYDASYNSLPDVTLNSYFIVGAYAQYVVNKNFKIFADGKNITNQKFFDINGYNSIPTLINGGVSFNW